MAVEVLGNIDAMVFGIDHVVAGEPITVDMPLEVHRRLLAGTRLEEHGGRFRDQQNWIGGSAYNPCSADFVPPPPEFVEDPVDDVIAFSNEDLLPAVAQAAIVPAQFETIHPFVDGNVGRAEHWFISFSGVGAWPFRVLPPVSLVLATWSQDYLPALTASRSRGRATSNAARDGVNLWIGRFAGACKRAVDVLVNSPEGDTLTSEPVRRVPRRR